MPVIELSFESSLRRTVLLDCSRAFARTLRLGTNEGLEMGDTILGDDLMGLGPMVTGSLCGRLFMSLRVEQKDNLASKNSDVLRDESYELVQAYFEPQESRLSEQPQELLMDGVVLEVLTAEDDDN
jgi:hypothetical protein